MKYTANVYRQTTDELIIFIQTLEIIDTYMYLN